jgi:hypothetical protein
VPSRDLIEREPFGDAARDPDYESAYRCDGESQLGRVHTQNEVCGVMKKILYSAKIGAE